MNKAIVMMLMKALYIPFFWHCNDSVNSFSHFNENNTIWRDGVDEMPLISAQKLLCERVQEQDKIKDGKFVRFGNSVQQISEEFDIFFNTSLVPILQKLKTSSK
jgi:hypothetical protein